MSSGAVRRVTSTLAAGLVLAVAPAQLASAHERHPTTAQLDDQQVVELTTKGSQARSGLAYHQTQADDVTATNAAVAYAACDGCRAVSLSFQVVVADGGPDDLDVGNVAVAMTENCSGCESVAVAYQLVLSSAQRLRLTDDGRHALANLRRQLRRLARSDLPPLEVQSQAAALMGGVTSVLAQELKVRPKVRYDQDVERRPDKRPPPHFHRSR